MPRVVVRKGYRCKPGKRREVLAALQRVDEAGAAAGWPRGRYLFVESRAPGEPDLEVEFTFESYAEMERLERRLREHLARTARDVAGAGQDLLIEPSATRYLLLLDEAAARAPGQARQESRQGPPPDEPSQDRQQASQGSQVSQGSQPPQTLAQQRARQLAEARAAMESAERTVGLPPERRASQRRPAPPPRARPAPPEALDEADETEEPDEAMDASA